MVVLIVREVEAASKTFQSHSMKNNNLLKTCYFNIIISIVGYIQSVSPSMVS